MKRNGGTVEHHISVNQEICIGCELCVKVCPALNIEKKEGEVQILRETCLFCGHCAAVCPQKAISISGYEEEGIEPESGRGIKPEDLLYALKIRRSIRFFQKKPISKEALFMIIETGRVTPTAKNMQDVEYIILEGKKDELEAKAVKLFRRILKVAGMFNKRFRTFTIEEDFFFKQAPLVILVAAKDKTNGILASANMALMAESLGLGVLYNGFFTAATRFSCAIKKELNLKNKKIWNTLVIGYPAIRYQRGVQRERAKVTRL